MIPRSSRTSRIRRSLARVRRRRVPAATPASATRPALPPAAAASGPIPSAIGWDVDAVRPTATREPPRVDAPITAQVLALFSDPQIHSVTPEAAAHLLGLPRPDVSTALEALLAAGELVEADGPRGRAFAVPPEHKAHLEALFRDSARELGEAGALVRVTPGDVGLAPDDDDEPRLPVTAGLLSLFLPGTGQLLNGDVGRASLVFAVWSLALLTHLSPIWTFVALYAGAEAFFTAKIRSMERKLALEAAPVKKPLRPA